MAKVLHIQYDFIPSEILDPATSASRIALMQAAGVETVWLDVYAYGNRLATKQEIHDAKALLESHGFEVQVVTVPVGHGGAALLGDAGDPGVPGHWQLRVNPDGSPMPFTACVRNQAMLRESREVAEELYAMGFTKLFFDDDLRVGHWGRELRGCCCKTCMSAFYQKYPQYAHLSAPEIFSLATEGDDLWNAWCDVQCDAILEFMQKTVPEGMIPGIMVMHNGDSRHGADITRIKNAFPRVLFRVGEAHFGDHEFCREGAQREILCSIGTHLSLIGDAACAYSESTVYPENALSPENLVQKLRLEIGAGLRNLFLMSGFFFLGEPYWQAIAKDLPELEALAQAPRVQESETKFVW